MTLLYLIWGCMPKSRSIGAAVKTWLRHERTHTPTDTLYLYLIYKDRVCLRACVSVCSCLNHVLTAAPIDLIFGMHTHIRYRSVIGYIFLTFEVNKGHFRSNRFLCKVPEPSFSILNQPSFSSNLDLNISPSLLMNNFFVYERILTNEGLKWSRECAFNEFII